MTWTIAKRHGFAASHVLEGLPAGHQCGRLHGHNYEVEVELAADQLDAIGMVLDYGALDALWQLVDFWLDHRHLNDVPDMGNPTAERVAAWVYKLAVEVLAWPHHGFGGHVAAVRVYETPRTWAEYRP